MPGARGNRGENTTCHVCEERPTVLCPGEGHQDRRQDRLRTAQAGAHVPATPSRGLSLQALGSSSPVPGRLTQVHTGSLPQHPLDPQECL